jgi:hypothetical protein
MKRLTRKAAGCVMVMNGFLNARRDENWKMTVIHGLGVAGSVPCVKRSLASSSQTGPALLLSSRS